MTHRGKLTAMFTRFWPLVVAALCLATAPLSAAAQNEDATRNAARQLGAQGVEAFWAEDYRGADDKLDQAYHLFPTPTLGLWSGRARVKRGRWVEAAERFREAQHSEIVGDVAAQKQAQQDAATELNELSPRIPSLTLQLPSGEPSDLEITLDDQAVPSALLGVERPTNPGAHRVVAVSKRSRDERFEAEVQLSEKEHKALPIVLHAAVVATTTAADPSPATAPTDLQPAAAATTTTATASDRESTNPAWLEPVAIGAIAVGGASLIASGITFALARSKLDSYCPDETCESQDQVDSYKAVKTVSTVTFYAGALAAVGGVVMWLAAKDVLSTPADQRMSWNVGPGSVSVRGTF
ncbi:MAG: hypothetical protein ABW321_07670 [Polyangiales bacterium]